MVIHSEVRDGGVDLIGVEALRRGRGRGLPVSPSLCCDQTPNYQMCCVVFFSNARVGATPGPDAELALSD